MSTYDLGPLPGNTWYQHSNSAGQVYYQNTSSGTIQYSIPTGWEDAPQDTWSADSSRSWPQWRNRRTGRIVLSDPDPPSDQTYLDSQAVGTHLSTVERTANSPESLYRRAMGAILRWLFPEREGFDVVKDEDRDSRPDFVIVKICCRPGGSEHAYDFCVVESGSAGRPWGATEDQCANRCDSAEKDDQVLYAIVQIGLEVAFYKYEDGTFGQLSPRMHLRQDVRGIMGWAKHLKENPLPLVR